MGGGGSLYTYVFLLRKASGSQGWFKLAELISRKPCNYKIEFVAGLRKSFLPECRADWAIQTTLHWWCAQMWWGFMKKFQSLNLKSLVDLKEIQFHISANFCLLCPISRHKISEKGVSMRDLYWILHSYKFLNVWYNRILGEIKFPGFPELSHKYSRIGYIFYYLDNVGTFLL